MKKYLNTILVLFLTVILTSCFGKTNTDEDIEDVKQQLLNWENNSSNSWISEEDDLVQKYEDNMEQFDNLEESQNNNISPAKFDDYSVEVLTEESFIELNTLDATKFKTLEVELTWTTLTNVDKIVINFSNPTSQFPNDNYTLQSFKAWDKTFLYRAFSRYQTLDYGTNTYIIEAYSWDKVSKLELTIDIYKESEKTPTTSENAKVNADWLPTSTEYGNPVNMGSNKLTYSDIKWLEITKIEPDLSLTTSEEINSFLIEQLNWWFYWNSLRPISWSAGASVYVVRLEWDKYIYEKHYYTPDWYHWVLFLEEWTWVDRDNIWEKNIELRDQNADFSTSSVADKLFRDLMN